MNYCAAANQIKTYAPTSTGNTLFAKNIDCVTLDADLVATNTLTVAGVDLSGITDIITKTQYQTASANNTTFSGNVTTPGITTGQIQALNPTTGISVPSILSSEITNSAGGINLYLINAGLTSASNNFGMRIGSSKTVTNAGWDMLYTNTTGTGTGASSASTSNRLDFKMAGQTASTLSMVHGLVGINKTAPTEALDVGGNLKVSGYLAVTGTTYSPLGQAFTGVWASTAGVNAYKYENMLANNSLYNTSYFPRVYTFLFTNLRATGFGVSTDKPLFRIGYGVPTTWGTNYSGVVVNATSSSNVKEEATTNGIPIAPVLAGSSWTEANQHSGSLTLTYMMASGGGYIYKWDLINTYYIPGGTSSQASTVQGSGYIFGSTSLGRPTAIGIFNGITDTYPTVKLYAQIINAHIV